MYPETRTDDLHPVVAVPVRNEERRLPRLLVALDRQSGRSASPPLDVVLVLNNCSDASLDVAKGFAATLSNLRLRIIDVVLPCERSHVGFARRMAMDRALALCRTAGQGVILTTDADAVPEDGWVEANLRAISRGADMAGGKLVGNREEEAQLGPGFAARAAAMLGYADLCDRLAAVLDPLSHDPWPRHSDHTGGSLAIRADVYDAVGGLPPLPQREDLALVSKVRARGGKLVHPLDIKVEVSARLVGRAPGGMADCLKQWVREEAEGKPLLVETPARVEARLLRRQGLRFLAELKGGERDAAASRLGLRAEDLFDERGEARSGAALVEHHAPDEPDAPATSPVAAASARIARMIADRMESTHAA